MCKKYVLQGYPRWAFCTGYCLSTHNKNFFASRYALGRSSREMFGGRYLSFLFTKHARNLRRNTFWYQILWILRPISKQSHILWDKWPEFQIVTTCTFHWNMEPSLFNSVTHLRKDHTVSNELLLLCWHLVAELWLFSRFMAIYEPNDALMFLRVHWCESVTQPCTTCEYRGFRITHCKLFTISIIRDTYRFHKFFRLVFRLQHASTLNTFLHRSCWCD